MLHIKTIPSINGNGKQMKECDNTFDCNVRVFWKNKSVPFVPLWQKRKKKRNA